MSLIVQDVKRTVRGSFIRETGRGYQNAPHFCCRFTAYCIPALNSLRTGKCTQGEATQVGFAASLCCGCVETGQHFPCEEPRVVLAVERRVRGGGGEGAARRQRTRRRQHPHLLRPPPGCQLDPRSIPAAVCGAHGPSSVRSRSSAARSLIRPALAEARAG